MGCRLTCVLSGYRSGLYCLLSSRIREWRPTMAQEGGHRQEARRWNPRRIRDQATAAIRLDLVCVLPSCPRYLWSRVTRTPELESLSVTQKTTHSMHSTFKIRLPSSKSLGLTLSVPRDNRHLIRWGEDSHRVLLACLVWLERYPIITIRHPRQCHRTTNNSFRDR